MTRFRDLRVSSRGTHDELCTRFFFLWEIVFFEPVSIPKAVKIVEARSLHAITYMKPNLEELVAIVAALQGKPFAPLPDTLCTSCFLAMNACS